MITFFYKCVKISINKICINHRWVNRLLFKGFNTLEICSSQSRDGSGGQSACWKLDHLSLIPSIHTVGERRSAWRLSTECHMYTVGERMSAWRLSADCHMYTVGRENECLKAVHWLPHVYGSPCTHTHIYTNT